MLLTSNLPTARIKINFCVHSKLSPRNLFFAHEMFSDIMNFHVIGVAYYPEREE